MAKCGNCKYFDEKALIYVPTDDGKPAEPTLFNCLNAELDDGKVAMQVTKEVFACKAFTPKD